MCAFSTRKTFIISASFAALPRTVSKKTKSVPEHTLCSGTPVCCRNPADQSKTFSTVPSRIAFIAVKTTLWLMVESLISVAE